MTTKICLFFPFRYGHFEVTELLVKHGASVNACDLWRFTPLHEGAAKGKYEIVQGLSISDASRQRMQATEDELRQEREAIAALL